MMSDKPCLIRVTRLDLNPVLFNYYPFMISLDKCNESCNVLNDLCIDICVLFETKKNKC